MDPFTAAIGLATAAFGAYQSYQAGQSQNANYAAQAEIAARISRLSRQQEQIRRQEMREEYLRTVRNSVRQQNMARAIAISRGVNQGAQFSSSIQGATSQVAQEGANQRTAAFGSVSRGEKMFDLNDRISRLNALSAQYGGQLNYSNNQIAQGNALFNIGSSITQNSTKIANTLDFKI